MINWFHKSDHRPALTAAYAALIKNAGLGAVLLHEYANDGPIGKGNGHEASPSTVTARDPLLQKAIHAGRFTAGGMIAGKI